ncbi:MAG: pyrrolysine--tRNA(Pyl) ligase small subunit [Oscillospiraceae bacterium]
MGTIRIERKKQPLSVLVSTIKLWSSRSGFLHGIRQVEQRGDLLLITTHCGETFTVNNSRHSRSDRWLRNRIFVKACEKCKIPAWKLEKYKNTVFR